MSETTIPNTLNDQIERLVGLGFADAAGVSSADFRENAGSLREQFDEATAAGVPPILVASSSFVPAKSLIAKIDRQDGKPQTVIHAEEHAEYRTIDGLAPPQTDFYLLVGFDREPATRNVAPVTALESIASAGRSPLTIDEGLALFAQWPECV